jgi:hypothetical protein
MTAVHDEGARMNAQGPLSLTQDEIRLMVDEDLRHLSRSHPTHEEGFFLDLYARLRHKQLAVVPDMPRTSTLAQAFLLMLQEFPSYALWYDDSYFR